ncbi:MAG: SPASM domain-containing protein, partial [Clostridiales bacterium]|nr:SPASM domain-containing protein [Clostridiales bacterium]
VRGTFTRNNLDFSQDVLHLADLGFKQISVEPVVAAKDSGYDLREEDLPVLFSEYEKLAAEYEKRGEAGEGFNFFHFMLDLDHGPCAIKRLKGCGSGSEYVAITPEGDIYPCHQFVGMENFKMGNVFESNEVDSKISGIFGNSNIYTRNDCMECWARFYCSGGCPANAYQFNNDINKPYKIGCELEKKRVECALWIKVKELTSEEGE